MKTEWMYFMAGAGLMAAVMSFNMQTLPYLDVYKFCIAVETLKEE